MVVILSVSKNPYILPDRRQISDTGAHQTVSSRTNNAVEFNPHASRLEGVMVNTF